MKVWQSERTQGQVYELQYWRRNIFGKDLQQTICDMFQKSSHACSTPSTDTNSKRIHLGVLNPDPLALGHGCSMFTEMREMLLFDHETEGSEVIWSTHWSPA